jgi:hypothetical protein
VWESIGLDEQWIYNKAVYFIESTFEKEYQTKNTD